MIPVRPTGPALGVFDSGVGGLTVVRSLLARVPQEEVLYVGDTARAPYGGRPIGEVRAIALEVLDSLVAAGVKALVIACNSASAAVLHDARERYDVPVFEVVHPAVRRAVAATRNGRVGVIGTSATIRSGAYEDAFVAAPHIRLVTQACPAFVDLVEAGSWSGPAVAEVAHGYLDHVRDAGVDTVVLGCTHYPVLSRLLQQVLGADVTLVESADGVAEDVSAWLAASGAHRDPGLPAPRHRFVATGSAAAFRVLARRLLGARLNDVVHCSVEDLGDPQRVVGGPTARRLLMGVST